MKKPFISIFLALSIASMSLQALAKGDASASGALNSEAIAQAFGVESPAAVSAPQNQVVRRPGQSEAVAKGRPEGPQAFSLIDRFDRQFVRLDSLIFRSSVFPSVVVLPEIDSTEVNTDELDKALANEARARVREMKGNTGLSVSGQAYYRIDNPIIIDNDDDDRPGTYDIKAQLEVRWSIFQMNLFHRKGKERAINIQQQIEHNLVKKELLSTAFADNYRIIDISYQGLLSGLLHERLENMNVLIDARTYLADIEANAGSDLLGLLKDRADIERQIANMDLEAQSQKRYPRFESVTIEVDTVALFDYILNGNLDVLTIDRRIELSKQEGKNLSYWDGVELAPFARYSHYIAGVYVRSTALDAGVTVKFPISSTTSRRRKTFEATSRLQEARRDVLINQLHHEMMLRIAEIYRINSAIRLQYDNAIELRDYLRQRTEMFQSFSGSYNRFLRMRDYEVYMHEVERVINLQYNLEKSLMALQQLIGDRSILDFCQITPLAAL